MFFVLKSANNPPVENLQYKLFYCNVAIVIALETDLYQSCHVFIFLASGTIPCPSNLGVCTLIFFHLKMS